MDLPVKFPSETEVILEDVARFRALSPQDRFEVIRDMLITAAFIMRISPKAAWARQYAIDEAELERLAIREFIVRRWILTPATIRTNRSEPSNFFLMPSIEDRFAMRSSADWQSRCAADPGARRALTSWSICQ